MSFQAQSYDRRRDLPRLVRLWPDEAVQLAANDHPRLMRLLTAELRAERQRGQARAWSYDLVRHRALLRAWRAESTVASGNKLTPLRADAQTRAGQPCRNGSARSQEALEQSSSREFDP